MQKDIPVKIFSFHTSRFGFFWWYIFFIALFVAGMLGLITYDLKYYWLFLLLILFGFIGWLTLEIKIRSKSIILGKDGVIIKMGILSKNTTRVAYNNICDIRVNQSILQRLFRYGDLEFGVPGSTIQQKISQHFSGRGDVKIEPDGSRPHGIVLKKIQRVGAIESVILHRIREKSTHMR